jgi:hypothetical protein
MSEVIDDNEDFDPQDEFQMLFQRSEEEKERLTQGIIGLSTPGGPNHNPALAIVMEEVKGLWDFLGQVIATSGSSFDLVSPDDDGDEGGSRLTSQDAAELRALLLVLKKLVTEAMPTAPAPDLLQKVLSGIETKLQWVDEVAMDDGDEDDDDEDDSGVSSPDTVSIAQFLGEGSSKEDDDTSLS